MSDPLAENSIAFRKSEQLGIGGQSGNVSLITGYGHIEMGGKKYDFSDFVDPVEALFTCQYEREGYTRGIFKFSADSGIVRVVGRRVRIQFDMNIGDDAFRVSGKGKIQLFQETKRLEYSEYILHAVVKNKDFLKSNKGKAL